MKDLQGNEIILGPTPDVELNLIKAIIQQTKPTVLVELGHLEGASARAMLSVMDGTQHLYSFDPGVDTSIRDSKFTFFKLKAEEFDTVWDYNLIDFIFFDASHDYESNVDAFNKLEKYLSKDAIIIVHDTGRWDTSKYTDIDLDIHDGYHRHGEVMFVKYLGNLGYKGVTFSTTKEFRCGLTVLQ